MLTVAGACSGDSEQIEASKGFCDARVEFEAVLSVETPNEADIDRALTDLVDTAPPELEHELAVFRIHDTGRYFGRRDAPAAAGAGGRVACVTNAAHASADATNTSVAVLRQGRYAAICIIPSEDPGQPHYTEGMFTESPSPDGQVSRRVSPG